MSVCCRGNAPSLGGGNVFYGNLATIYYLSGATGWGPMFDGHPAVLWNPPVPFTYTTNSDGITLTITEYTGSDATATIPSSINFLPVTGIGIFAFFNCNVISVTIPNSVTNIEEDAFRECSSLTNVTLGSGVTSIGLEAFGGCSGLTSVTIPSSVINIEEYGFEGCSGLVSIYFTGNAPGIDSVVFAGDPATVYYLPGTTGWNTFNANSELQPAALWLPEVQTSDASFGVQTKSIWIQHQMGQRAAGGGGSLHGSGQSRSGSRCKPTRSPTARPISAIRSGRIIPAASTASARRDLGGLPGDGR